MTTLTLQLDNDAIREATTQAILGTLTPEARDKILQTAVSELISKKTGSYGTGKSQLEEAFEYAVRAVATAEAKRIVTEDAALRAKIEELLRLTADKVLSADTDKLAERMADAFAASMRKDY